MIFILFWIFDEFFILKYYEFAHTVERYTFFGFLFDISIRPEKLCHIQAIILDNNEFQRFTGFFFSKAKGVIEIIARDEKLKTKVVKMMNNSICKPHHKIGHS